MSLGAEIKRLRINAGLSQATLSRRADTSQPYIAQLETGTRTQISADTLFQLAAALEVDCKHFGKYFPGQPVSEVAVAAPEPGKKKPRRKGSADLAPS